MQLVGLLYYIVNKTDHLHVVPVLVFFHGGGKKSLYRPVLRVTSVPGYTFGNPRNFPFEHWINQSPNVVSAYRTIRLPRTPNHSSKLEDFDLNVVLHDQKYAL